ncbi:MAG TPA: hypothetical protein P5119_04305 [Candidatus Aminicenantes bacterium]|nr:hypothetical protein [Candidatus Aminicenantes bacterium]HRY64547.1 hypothetical protein [Candidatus Aminicenantes bacterium]HRZ71460.1 hypothetical protein [Candidatus Aminicenantes bacterium]
MSKRNDSPSSKAETDVKPAGEKTMKRRDFVGAMAKAAIPTIAVLALTRPGRLSAKPAAKGGDLDKGFSKGPNDCIVTCENGCRGCEGECLGTCKDACFLTCEGSCKYTCEGGCNGTCEGTCKGSCDKGCSGQAW